MTSKVETKKKINLSITNPKVFDAIKLIIAILIALAITFVLLLLISNDAVYGLKTILTGPLQKSRYFGEVITRTIPYAFAGLGCALIFKSGAFNLGAEGIFTIAGVAIAAVATTDLSSMAGLHPYLCVLAGMVVGAILTTIPAILRATLNINEMVSSLMLNSVYSCVSLYIIRNYMLTTTTSTIGSKDYIQSAIFGYIYEPLKITPCLIILLVCTVIVYLIMYKTKLGYQIRLSGTNAQFAEYSGINSMKLSIETSMIAGALFGIGSACQLLTQTTFFQPDKSVAGIGFSGNLLAMLGKNNPIGVVISSFFIQYLEKGTNVLYFKDQSVPSEIVAIVEGVVILLISSQYFLRSFREKKLLKDGLEK
ncbi:MAG: ABC transporter permease [Erysipelotrichaceae bacterium]|nr:ABC transporter permease [Erysipelotrichaceae bacterium]